MMRRAGTTVLILGTIPLTGCAVYGDSGGYYPATAGYYESPGYYVTPGYSTTYVPYPVYYGSSYYHYESYGYPERSHGHYGQAPPRPTPPNFIRPDRDSHGRGYDQEHDRDRHDEGRDQGNRTRERGDDRGWDRRDDDRGNRPVSPELRSPGNGRPPQSTPRSEPPRRVETPPRQTWSEDSGQRLRAAVRNEQDRQQGRAQREQRGSPRATPDARADREPSRSRGRLQTDEP